MTRTPTSGTVLILSVIVLLAGSMGRVSGQEIIELGDRSANCQEDPACFNRIHPEIPMVARAHQGQQSFSTVVMPSISTSTPKHPRTSGRGRRLRHGSPAYGTRAHRGRRARGRTQSTNPRRRAGTMGVHPDRLRSTSRHGVPRGAEDRGVGEPVQGHFVGGEKRLVRDDRLHLRDVWIHEGTGIHHFFRCCRPENRAVGGRAERGGHGDPAAGHLRASIVQGKAALPRTHIWTVPQTARLRPRDSLFVSVSLAHT